MIVKYLKNIPIYLFSLLPILSFGQTFHKLESGLEYHFIKQKKSKFKAKPGDIATMHITFKVSDSTIIDSKAMNNHEPIEQPLSAPNFKGDVFEGILKMKKGEIAHFRLPVKEFYTRTEQANIPEWVKPESFAEWHVEMVELMTEKDHVKAATVKAAKQTKIDNKIIEAHLSAKGIKMLSPKHSTINKADSMIAYKESGIYYIVHQIGTGQPGSDNSNVSVNYTGYLLDGLVFDSNTDPKYKHVEPIKFTVGKGQMIKGWDKILPLMKVGHKITVFIPSPLAYGPQARPPHIPANGILVFDMELLEVE